MMMLSPTASQNLHNKNRSQCVDINNPSIQQRKQHHSELNFVYAHTPGMFEFDEIASIGCQEMVVTKTQQNGGEQASSTASGEQKHTAEFASINFASDQNNRETADSINGRKNSMCGSLIEQEVNRIKEATLRRHSQQIEVDHHPAMNNYHKRQLVRNDNERVTQQQNDNYSQQQLPAELLSGSQSTKNLIEEPLEMVCDTRIKRMKNLLIEAKKKIAQNNSAGEQPQPCINPEVINSPKQQMKPENTRITYSDAYKQQRKSIDNRPLSGFIQGAENHNQRGVYTSQSEQCAPQLCGEQRNDDGQLQQWKSDLEMVRDSLRRLQEENMVIGKPHNESRIGGDTLSKISTDRGKHYDHNIQIDHAEQQTLLNSEGRVKKLRFDTDETYLALLGKQQQQEEAIPYSRQSIQENGISPHVYQTVPLALQQQPMFFIDGQPLQMPAGRHRDESIERRVKEAKVNLEWKIALKLKQRLSLDGGITPDKAHQKIEEHKEEERPRGVPSHIVKTLQKSKLTGLKGSANQTLSSNQSIDTMRNQIGLQSVESFKSYGQKPYSPQKNAIKILSTEKKISPNRKVLQQYLSANSKDKTVKVSRPGSPEYQSQQNSEQKAAKPIKVIYRVQRTTVTSYERNSNIPEYIANSNHPAVATTRVTSPVKNNPPSAKLVKPPIGQQRKERNSQASPPKVLAYRKNNAPAQNEVAPQTGRRSMSTMRKPAVPVQERKSLRMASNSLGHSRNVSIGPQPLSSNASAGPKKLIIKNVNKQAAPQQTNMNKQSPSQNPSLKSSILQNSCGTRQPSVNSRAKSPNTFTRNQDHVSRSSINSRVATTQQQSNRVSQPKITSPDSRQLDNQQSDQEHTPFRSILRPRVTSPPKQEGSAHTTARFQQSFKSPKSNSIINSRPLDVTLMDDTNTEWVKNCDDRIMRFIATSPSKNTKTRLLGGGNKSSLSQTRNSQHVGSIIRQMPFAKQIVVSQADE